MISLPSLRRIAFFSSLIHILLFPLTASLASEDVSEIEDEYMSLYFSEEDLVEVTTRYPKPIIHIAENVTTITAEEIEAMNAHHVADVLNQVTGVFVQYWGADFGSASVSLMQGSDYEHVLVLLDGVRWNTIGTDFTEPNNIPVGIIKRIEIIKGPASSTWGSALGGVINIITKDTGSTEKPSGSVRGSYGEANARDFKGETEGKIGPAGYYLFAGRQDSDGHGGNRFFERKSVYGKTSLELPGDASFTLSAGLTEPHFNFLEYPPPDEGRYMETTQIWFANGNISFKPSSSTGLYFAAHTREEDSQWDDISLLWGNAVYEYDARSTGVEGRFNWTSEMQTLVLGAEYEKRKDKDPLRPLWNPVDDKTQLNEVWAFYMNDTITAGKFTITPGIRYDRFLKSANLWSPSLGVVYRLSNVNLLRATAARGFRAPPLTFVGEGSSLEAERINSFQGGLENSASKYMRVKVSIFRHDMKNAWKWSDQANDWVSKGEALRKGIEAEVETVSFKNLSVHAGYAYIHDEPVEDEIRDDYLAQAKLLLEYDNLEGINAQLFGQYVHWNKYNVAEPAEFHDSLWDFTVAKKLTTARDVNAETFFTVHNLLNGDQYNDASYKNTKRWAEAGLKISF